MSLISKPELYRLMEEFKGARFSRRKKSTSQKEVNYLYRKIFRRRKHRKAPDQDRNIGRDPSLSASPRGIFPLGIADVLKLR